MILEDDLMFLNLLLNNAGMSCYKACLLKNTNRVQA